jgi:hypothetical protein
MNGIARRVRSATEGQKIVLRFRLETAEGRTVPIELRGVEIRGDLAEGDRIEVQAGVTVRGDAAVRLPRIMNLTTDSTVEAWNPSALHQARSLVGKEALSAAIGAGVTFTIGGLLRINHEESPSPTTTSIPPGSSMPTASNSSVPPSSIPPSSGSTTPTSVPTPRALEGRPIGILVILILLALLWYLSSQWRRRRLRHEPFLPTVLGLGAGALLALLLLVTFYY